MAGKESGEAPSEGNGKKKSSGEAGAVRHDTARYGIARHGTIGGPQVLCGANEVVLTRSL